MRKLPLGVVISTAVHAVALTWVGASVLPRRPPDEVKPKTEIEIEIVDVQSVKPPQAAAVEAPPVEVALLDEPKPEAPVAPPRVAPPVAPVAPSHPEISTGQPTRPEVAPDIGAGAGSETEPPRTPSTGALSMRREKPNLELPGGQWNAIDHVPKGTDAEKDIHSGLLNDAAGGLHKTDQGTFTGKVNADGTIALKDARNLSVHLALPSPRDIGNGLSTWYEKDKWGAGFDGDSRALSKHIQATHGASTNLDARDQPNDNDTDHTPTVIAPIIGGSFDTTDWLMRRHGQDPYASKKLKVLDATRDERAQIGSRHRDQQLRDSARLMTQSLEELRHSRASLAERKEALFELWDDCAESGDTREVSGAADARRLVISFIQLHLPAGGADAYTPAELAALARRKHSKAAFQPYEP